MSREAAREPQHRHTERTPGETQARSALKINATWAREVESRDAMIGKEKELDTVGAVKVEQQLDEAKAQVAHANHQIALLHHEVSTRMISFVLSRF